MEKLHVSAYSGRLQVLATFLLKEFNYYYYYYYYYLLQLGCHPVAVVILHVNKT